MFDVFSDQDREKLSDMNTVLREMNATTLKEELEKRFSVRYAEGCKIISHALINSRDRRRFNCPDQVQRRDRFLSGGISGDHPAVSGEITAGIRQTGTDPAALMTTKETG